MEPDQALAAARTLKADATTVEVATALDAAGVRPILLKGPVFARWLYGDAAEVRSYVDVDLLVEQRLLPPAERVLADLGFVQAVEDVPKPEHGLTHSHPWVRAADLAQVDLHQTLFGAGAAPADVWAALTHETERIAVAGVELEALNAAGCALHAAMHAAQHVHNAPRKSREDLTRAVATVPETTWREAMALAERLDATPTVVLGLDLLPEGRELARRLGAVEANLARAATEPGSRANLAVGIDRLIRAPRMSARLNMVAREVVPPRDFMRWWSALARRGPLGMALAYLWRPVWLALRLPPSIAAWRRHRRREPPR